MAEPLPAVDAPVVIVGDNNREHRSQVVAVGAGELTLRRPDDIVAGDPFLIGDEMLLTWPDGVEGGNGIRVVRARLTAIRRQDDARLWDVATLGDPRREQRRGFIRVAVSGAITLTQIIDDTMASLPPRASAGELLDVSEAGLRCAVDLGDVWVSRRNAAVTASFSIGSDGFELTGRVVASKVSTLPGRREVAVVFDLPIPRVEELRRQVMQLQPVDRRNPAAT